MKKLSSHGLALSLKRKRDLVWFGRIKELGLVNNKRYFGIVKRLKKLYKKDCYYFHLRHTELIKRKLSVVYVAHLLRRYREGVFDK